MAKKAKKGKPAKKAAKPAKKAAAKMPAKKAAPKKASKPAKKASKPAKKAVGKKVVKKAAPKKASKPAKKAVAKKVAPKKVAKKVVKKVAKKVVAKKVVKKVAPKKVVAKKVAKPVAKPARTAGGKAPAKPVAKVVTKPVAKAVVAKPAPVVKKAEPVSKKKSREFLTDDDYSSDEAPMIVEYKTPSIRKPMGPAPKPHINTDTRTRYSDNELKEFKELIRKKLGEAQKDYELLKSTLSHKDDHGTDDTSPTFKLLEDGSDVLSKEETAHLASRQEKFIQNLQNALIRIENKTYGICRATGKLISKERLRSVPHATLAIEAKLEQSR